MTRSLFEPELLRKLISEKKRQLREIQEDLKKLPLEDSSRPRLLERMWHLLKGIPQLEAKLAELTEKRARCETSCDYEQEICHNVGTLRGAQT